MFICGFCRSIVTFGVDKIQDEHPGLWLNETYFTFFSKNKTMCPWSHQTCQKCACRVLKKCCYFPKSKMIFLASILPRHFILYMFSWALHAKSPKWLEIFTWVKCCYHTFRNTIHVHVVPNPRWLSWSLIGQTYSTCSPELFHGKASDCQQCPLECYFSRWTPWPIISRDIYRFIQNYCMLLIHVPLEMLKNLFSLSKRVIIQVAYHVFWLDDVDYFVCRTTECHQTCQKCFLDGLSDMLLP